jgi:crotonobetainyl-CoA:carnitine CoA-transferase CaiB-like acyl-CoA transferase
MDLSAVCVVDLTQLLPGPYATQLLCDMGAEVVKIEHPDGGDPGRQFVDRPEADGTGYESSPLFDVVNRGKRGATLDLKRDRGRAALLDVAVNADVVIEQFRPGVVDRLGVGYDDVRAVNGDVVYCSVTGYGQTGPYSERAGHDLNYAGAAGLVDMTRHSTEEQPVIPGFPVADMAGGLFAALSVVGALLSRELGDGGGEHLDVGMADAVLSLSQVVAGPAAAGGDRRPGRTVLTGKYPCYDVYECADGRYVTVAALEERFWEALCAAIDRPDLAGAHMADGEATRERVRRELADVFATRPREAWLDDLADAEAMIGPVKTVTEAFEDPQFRARPVVQEVDGLLRRAAFPVRTSAGLERTEAPAPALGEHTDEVLREAGYTDEGIADLRAAGVV